jgi:pyruvate,water dikinase
VRLAELFTGHRDDVEVLRVRFARFRDLLEMNNRVLRLMADANEKLGGEYLFDSQYLHTLETDLSEAGTAIVHDLAEMSGNRYPRLLTALEHVQAAVRDSLEPQHMGRDLPLTLTLDELGTELADAVGEKMARLGEIRRHLAVPVPEGFVTTTRACELVLADPAIADKFEQYRKGAEGAAARLQAAITSMEPPAEVARAIKEALSRFSRNSRFAVRSSALGEDTHLSFAGQHETLLNVPRDRVLNAWLKVIASLFSEPARAYRRMHGLADAGSDMGVGCLLMVPAKAGGVIYSLDPNQPQSGAMIVSAIHGLGVLVVEGRGPVDTFRVSRHAPHEVLDHKIAEKHEMCVPESGEGMAIVPVSPELRGAAAIADDALARLADLALKIERHMKCSQDIEWALGEDGTITVVQARPLRLGPEARPKTEDLLLARARHRVLLQDCGEVACRGIGAGPVFVARSGEETNGFTPGDVLVTQFASPRLSELVATASALISETGSLTGHLATVAREYRVPAIMGAEDATRLLSPGSVITVDADENTVYEGSVEELLHDQLLRSEPYQEAHEFRALRRMLRHVSPLNLRDPSTANFAPENCRTYHDIIRFAHERALVELGRLEGIKLDGLRTNARTLELDIPLDLVVIDLGGGITPGLRGRSLARNQVLSRPLAVLMEGLLTPGVWATNPADMDLDGFMASATRAGPLTVPGSDAVTRNVALISADYLNLNLRVGYHFNVVDCYLGKNPEDSYIFFRFVGGVTDSIRRTRRARLLATILAQQDFKTELNGELVVGRLQGVPQAICEERLRMVGRLIGFSRQLDILLRDDATVDSLVNAFLQNRYPLDLDVLMKERSMASDIEVMVLDDEPTVCERLKDFLEKSGMKVEAFTDSSTAVERLAHKRFHVVVTDLKMKAPTGIDVLVTIKRQKLPTQVIVITGYRTMEATRSAEYVGAYAFLDKPFHLEQLRDLVKKAARKAGKHAAELQASTPR